jgi:N-dimethylarginine dimethylaminohydrolase
MLRVLLCPPNYFDVVDQKNPYMSIESAVDRVKARSQWENLCRVLQQSGCEVEIIDPVEGLEDMVFAANQVSEFGLSFPRFQGTEFREA